MEWKQELGVADHMTSTVRRQRELNAGALFIYFSFLFSPGHLIPTVRVGPLISVNPTEEFHYRHIQRFVSIVIQNLINLTIKINYDSWLKPKTRKWHRLLSLVRV